MGIGALTDFGPLLANPITFMLGAAAQLGVFIAVIGAMTMGFSIQEAAGIGIIGGLTVLLRYILCKAGKGYPACSGSCCIQLHVPCSSHTASGDQALTTKEDRAIKMEQLRPVSRSERILFPIVSTIACGLVLPASVPPLECLCSETFP